MPARKTPSSPYRVVACSIIAFAVLLVASVAEPPPALAQESATSIGKIFRRLRERFRQNDRRATRRKTRRKTRRSTSRRTQRAAAVEQVEEVEKLENARTVLVVGDFLAGGTAEGLEVAFAASPGVRIVENSSGSSGFVRRDFYNWPAEIGKIIDQEKPDVVVVQIGSNDRQSMYIVDRNEPVRSEAWLKEYEGRVTSMANAVTKKRVPLIWVGMPSFKYSKMSADMLAFNDTYRSVTERSGGTFVDIWDGFVNEENQFSRSGPDINGQSARLRSGDGINMTSAGKRKMAFYVEKPLRKLLGPAASPDIGALGPQSLAAVDLGASREGRLPGRTIPIALTDPALDGGTELLGAADAERPKTASLPGQNPGANDVANEPRPGRADNFSIPRPKVAVEPSDDPITFYP